MRTHLNFILGGVAGRRIRRGIDSTFFKRRESKVDLVDTRNGYEHMLFTDAACT